MTQTEQVPVVLPATTPRPWTGQLETGAPTEGEDCGVRAFINAVRVASDNLVGPPASWSGAERAWTARVREWMDKPTGATTTDDWWRAWHHPTLAALFRGRGLQLPVVQRMSGASWAEVPRHLAAGRVVMLCVRYGTLRDDPRAPVDAGGFMDGHALVLTGFGKDADGRGWTRDLDSLLDGPRRARIGAFRRAAGAFGSRPWGDGRLEGLSVRRARVLEVVDQVPELRRQLDGVLELAQQLTAAAAAAGAIADDITATLAGKGEGVKHGR